MKKTIRILVLFMAIALAASLFAVCVFAEEEETEHAYSIYDENGVCVGGGDTDTEIHKDFLNMPDGYTLKLNRDMRIYSCLFTYSTEDEPKTVNLDLCGNMLYVFEKIGTAVVACGNYTTLNVYSSLPEGVIYITNEADPTKGGCIFSILDNSAVLNAGTVTVGEETYPGSNLSTFSVCLIDLMSGDPCDENSSINLNGGMYHSIATDYSGFIIPRTGAATINIKDADILIHETRAPINSAGENTVLNIENTRIIQSEGTSVKLFNNAYGTVRLKNCVTNYALASSTASSTGAVLLEGRNVFSKNAGFDASLVAMEDAVLVRTASDYELACGGASYNYYDRTGKFNLLSANIPTLSEAYSVAEAANTLKYTFVMGDRSISELWSADEKPEKPFKLPSDKKPGVYKYSWNRTTAEDGTVVLTAGRVADFPIKVNMTYDINLCFNVYIPGFLVEEGYLDYKAVTIDREAYPRADWEKTVIDGTEYYKAMSGFIDEENADKKIEVFIPFDYDSKTRVETTYVLDLEKYLDRVIATEKEKVYTEEEYDLVYEIKGTYLPSADISDPADQSLYVKTSADSEWMLSKDGTHTVISGITWEPGYTTVSLFKVKNAASVPASVIFDIISASEISSLADVIDVFIAENVEDFPTDRGSVNEWTNIGTLADITSSVTVISDTVDGEGEKTYLIAFKMQESAGYEYYGIDLCDFDIAVTFGPSES